MDAMQLLRSFRDDQPELNRERLDALRLRTSQSWAGGAPAVRSGRRIGPARRWPVVVVGVAAAGTLAVGAVLVAPAPRASAVDQVLERASAAAQGSSSRGAYTVVRIREDALNMTSTGEGPVDAAYIGRTVTTLRVPNDVGVWTRSSYSLPTVTVFGGDAGAAFARQDAADAATKAHPNRESSRDGTFVVAELGGPNPEAFGYPGPAVFRRLPRDPAELLKAFQSAYLQKGDTRPQADRVIDAASRVLRSGVADGALQSAVFRALRLQPGLSITDHSVDLDGRRGIAVGAPATNESENDYSLQLIIDPDTGHYLGSREVTRIAVGVVPAGTVDWSTAVSTR